MTAYLESWRNILLRSLAGTQRNISHRRNIKYYLLYMRKMQAPKRDKEDIKEIDKELAEFAAEELGGNWKEYLPSEY